MQPVDPRPAGGNGAVDPVRTHHAACNLCEAICGLEFRVDKGEILSIRGDADDPLSRGHICPKAVALKDIYADPDRLREPQMREGDRWRSVAWDVALDHVAERLAEIHQRDGAQAIAAYLGNPNVHNYGSLTHARQLFGPIRTRNRYSATSVDQLPHQLVALWLFGHQLLIPIPDIDHTDLLFMFGANPMASNGSMMTVPDFRHRAAALQARGGRLVTFDPRRTETAAIADEHHFVRPGADAAVLAAMLAFILDERLDRPGRVAAFTDGLDDVRGVLAALDRRALAAYAGMELADIERLAAEFAGAPRAACYGRLGVSTQIFGTLCQWLIQMLNLFTGRLDEPGGVLFTTPAVDLVDSPVSRPGHFAAWHSRVRGLPEFGGELPAVCLSEEIETPGEGQVRALITMAGNPVLSTPGGARLAQAMRGLEFMVSVDIFRNETTGLADVILPPTHSLEHDHYDLIFSHFAVRNTVRFNRPLFERAEGALHDWEIFEALGMRLSKLLGVAWSPMPAPAQIIEAGLATGPWAQRKLTLAELEAHPHGLDLGPLKSQLPQRLYHQNKRIAAAPQEMLGDLQRLSDTVAGGWQGGLRLIGRRHLRSNNSWMHNSRRLTKGPARHQLLMHPDDLASRDLRDGQRVSVISSSGRVETEVAACPDLMPGVVSLPHGFGHQNGAGSLSVAASVSGVSANDLTDPAAVDPVSGNACLNGITVTVAAA